ncbi:PPE domain-containing protein, partial [Mycobacterium avium]
MSIYAGLPPEVNSARMYSGPGSESMLAAAAAWNALSAELRSVATDYESAIATLTGEGWFGPSAAKMSAAASRNMVSTLGNWRPSMPAMVS